MNAYRENKQSTPAALDPRPSALDSPLDSRRGFTLIELMIVVVIIALLVGLLVPAVMSSIRKARDAEVRTEISKLDTAISAFQAEYGGIAPPSFIEFPDDPANWDNFPRSKAIIRRIWPQFHFPSNGGNPNLTGTLNGAECLVFFLGGIREGTDGPLVGFSKNPATPFASGGSRVGPFYQFDIARLTETGGNPDAPEYLDPLPSQFNPYIYYSSYDGRGYRTMGATSELIGGMTSVYTQPGGTAAHKPNSHQIISPGSDGQYGIGGQYNAKSYTLPLADPDDDRTAEEDNITNFSSGRLVP